MGRKSNKGKEKRLARKEEQMRIAVAKEIVDKANKLSDPLEPFPVFRKFNKNGIEAELYIKRVGEICDVTKEWVFNLTKQNMKAKYEDCSWGWNDTKKYEELTDEDAWYLIAQSKDGKPIGFSHFRFDLDEGVEVLYCYELQIEPAVMRRGLGKFMMQILELVAFTNHMRKVVLTVLKHNKYNYFFKALNYQLDESSPVDDDEETYPYAILSKINKKLVNTNPLPSSSSINNHCDHCCSGHH
ncbi:Acetyltransferase (GNAT) family [Popillia japonica]|uniref:N-alpha-acetyltransferase 40 n=1 Tax=Popillia japonica TaxID=7064 RepID=A0AAW1ICB0_POPJA